LSLSLSLSLSSRLRNSVKRTEGFTIVELLIVIVVIAILAAITIVSYNGITQRAKESAKASELSSWKKKSELRKVEKSITCPENYSFVYGNTVLGTDDFCVMKYEAKNVGGVATSQASGAPWVSISQTDAITASTATGGHLLTDAEWMTIAADVLSVKYNWSGSEVGSGIIWQGHVNNNPGSALAASADDTDNLNGMTGGIGANSGNNSSRVLYLSSGDTIWDLSGNVYEWTQQAVGTPALTMNQVGVSGDSGFNWREWTLGSLSLGNLPASSRPSTLASYTNPITGSSLSAITGWDATKGVGRIYANYADAGSRAFVRGGYWSNGANAGVLTLSLGSSPSYTNTNFGFRVAR
ncbi:MAG: SUMF1/EgtB/PvdO family nonheme iron enzyme, partial [Candidatus Microsaccharimonas sp.]